MRPTSYGSLSNWVSDNAYPTLNLVDAHADHCPRYQGLLETGGKINTRIIYSQLGEVGPLGGCLVLHPVPGRRCMFFHDFPLSPAKESLWEGTSQSGI